ncbi:Predicted phospholipase, patatin/cPLA2 family [Bacillus sp. 491mf]|uniref:patatin-like phospholipase family protein n=1 Tax=Bacillus TaxID=1386 RepID=UPI00055116B8|nr:MULTISPECIES: patatin family protein [unclassified Bacillus (in: firmicutes)]SFD14167.1 Predicted phospholipase, patatin/cPLA2 family [Bacillus sp. 491mf]
MLENTGLVLEGGGMRGVYTAGVLEYFMENNLHFPYVIGVSAGACNAASYLSKQKERNKTVNIEYVTHPRYLSYKNFLKKRQLFDMDFIFHEIPLQHVPFDFETYFNTEQQFLVGTTDCETGQPVYFEKGRSQEDSLTVLQASSSLPFVAPVVEFSGKKLLDGGISDPIPVRKAQEDGYRKSVVILTRNKGYMKKKSKFGWIAGKAYKEYPKLVDAMLTRYEVYNETLHYIENEEAAGNIFVIRPTEQLQVDRMEKNPDKLQRLYDQGFRDAEKMHGDLVQFLSK